MTRKFRAVAVNVDAIVIGQRDFEYDLRDGFDLANVLDAPGVYEWVRDRIGGYVEVAPSPPDFAVFVDEDGYSKGLPINQALPAFVGTIVIVRERELS